MPQEIFHITSAGSVDDGKSTILARLLLDTGSVFEDQLGGVNPAKVDATTIADLLDGLESERTQGITIDVAHRFFDSSTRRYHIADSPGHEQYTRNMATAASQADALLLVVDARVGIKPQTLTHFAIARRFGIQHLIIAVNKMDLVGFRRTVFEKLSGTLDTLPGVDSLTSMVVVPVSGLAGDNIVKRSRKMPWHQGPTILEALDAIATTPSSSLEPVFSVQMVQRLPGGGRRYLGSLIQGTLENGGVVSSPRYRSREFSVREIIDRGENVDVASAPAEPAIVIDSEVDLDRGDLIGRYPGLSHTDQFEADLVWLDSRTGFPGRTLLVRVGHASVRGSMTRIFGIGEDSEKEGQRDKIEASQIVRVNLETHEKISVAAFADVSPLGRVVLIDPDTGDTVAAGVINHVLRRGENIIEHNFSVDSTQRKTLLGTTPRVVWFTGLSGSGKSTIANAVSVELAHTRIPHTVLDGDSLRTGLNKDLGFTEADRIENIRRTAEVAKLIADSGLSVLVSVISPFEADRQSARSIVGAERFIEVFVDTPLEICEQRDPKGLYQKARAGLIPNFTGVSAPYERPASPQIIISPEEGLDFSARRVLEQMAPKLSTGSTQDSPFTP